MLKTRLARLWLCQKTGRIRSFTNSIPCARVSTRHQRYEQSSTLEGLVHEASQASRGSSDNYRSLSKLICTVGPSTHSPSEIQNLVDIGMSVMRINCSKSTIEETTERVEWKDGRKRVHLDETSTNNQNNHHCLPPAVPVV